MFVFYNEDLKSLHYHHPIQIVVVYILSLWLIIKIINKNKLEVKCYTFQFLVLIFKKQLKESLK